MKRCPTCNKTFAEQDLSFCIDDGTPLVPANIPADETTVASPSPATGVDHSAATGGYKPRDWQAEYQPPGSYAASGNASKRKAWPWIVGILALLFIGIVGFGIAAAILIPNIMRSVANRNSSQANTNVERGIGDNTNLNHNSRAANENIEDLTGNTNTEAGEDTPGPPTDEEKVLADLTELEHEWTVVNINADKQKLDRILADDYVGTSSEGKSQGKAEYIGTIERDTSIQKWDFENLKAELKGNRASLSGVIRLEIKNQEVAYQFTDKFVWRDGRWQAVGSEVSPIKQ